MKVTIDTTGFLRDLNRFVPDLEKAIDSGIADGAGIVQEGAIDVHRYNRRTGALQSATRKKKIEDGYKVYIDENIASYGKYVHDGQKKWNPDRFIYLSAERNRKNVIALVGKYINKAVKRFNNG